MILRSKDRYLWENFYQLDDNLVTALAVDGNFLFAGTSPKGKFYRINLTTSAVTLDNTLDGEVVGFVSYNGGLYAATSKPSFVYKFNIVNNKWESFYKPYGTSLSQISSFDGKIWVAIDGENMVSYDGSEWKIEISNPDNISTTRKVSKNAFSYTTYDFINTKDLTRTDGLTNEEVLDIFPYNRMVGIGSFSEDGSTVTVGGKNHGRVFNYNNGELYSIFDSDKKEVQQLLNLDVGANLAAMEDSLYLIHCGDISTTASVPEEEVDDPNAGKTVVVQSPNGGENIIVGSEIDISWTSTRGINDGIKISLYKSGEENIIITNKTSNDGIFTWTVPLSLAEGSDYQIYIEWVSATDAVASTDFDLSNSNFSILVSEPEVTQTEEVVSDDSVPDISECRGIPIINFKNGEKITFMTKDEVKGGVLFATSLGRILYADEATLNAYRSGNRLIYAEVKNGFGKQSDTVASAFMYALYKRIFEINSKKDIKTWRYFPDASLYSVDRISAEFVSPVLQAQEDIGFWKELVWSEEKPDNTSITVCVKSGETKEKLEENDWDICFMSRDETSPITKSLNNVTLKGKFAQIKVIMETDSKDVTPKVTDVSLVYSTKRAQYFYTTKFSLESGSHISKGLLTGTISQPINTEIIFGYNDEDSSNWDDYTIIEMDKFFELSDLNSIKVGVKMISYDESLPVVDEFGVIFSGDKTNLLNK
jgi:hypothetical protein